MKSLRLLHALVAAAALAVLLLPHHTSAQAFPPAYLCQHTVGSQCSFSQPTLCSLITTPCQRVYMISPGLREIAVIVVPPTTADGLYSLTLTAASPGVDCAFPLFDVALPGKNTALNFTAGACMDFALGPNTAGVDEKVSYSIQPAECAQCATLGMPTDLLRDYAPENRTECNAILAKPDCDKDRECIWFGTTSVGCTTSLFASFLGSIASVCPLIFTEFDCVKFTRCKWANNLCVPKVTLDTERDNHPSLNLFVDNTVALPAVLNQGFDNVVGIPHRFVPECSEVTVQGFQGLRFHGWEYVTSPNVTSPFRTNSYSLYWVMPEAPIVLHTQPVSGQDPALGQNFILPPYTLTPGEIARGDAALALSIGTNGIAVFDYVPLTDTFIPTLVWDFPLSGSLHHIGVFIDAMGPQVYIDYLENYRESNTSAVSGRAVSMNPGNIGTDQYGGFKGVVAILRAGTNTTIAFMESSIDGEKSRLTKVCQFQLSAPLRPITPGGPFVIPAPVVQQEVHRNKRFVYEAVRLPSSLYLNKTSGVINGTLDATDEVQFTVTVLAPDLPACTGSVDYVISMLPAITVNISRDGTPHITTVGAPYFALPPAVAGGDGLYKYAMDNAPLGLTINEVTGVIQGSPRESGIFHVVVTAKDGNGGSGSASFGLEVARALAFKAKPVTATQGGPLTITVSTVDGGVPVASTARRRAANETTLEPAAATAGVFKYTLESPERIDGMTFDSTRGVLSGTPRQSGSFVVIIRIEDASGASVRDQTELSIAAPISVALESQNPRTTVQAVQFEAVNISIPHTVSGGLAPYTYIVNTLPDGLQLNPETGEIKGKPITVGRTLITISIRDANNAVVQVGSQELSVAAQGTSDSNRTTIIVAVVLSIFALCVLVFAVLWAKHKRSSKAHDFTEMLSDVFIDASASDRKVPREIRRNCVSLVSVMGSGSFGEVHKAMLDERSPGIPAYMVAVKQLKGGYSSTERDDLLAEAVIMANIEHQHLVGLIGVVTRGDPLMLVMQYMEHGSLDNFLKSHVGIAEISETARVKIARDISSGMDYFSSHGFVHRDLAARNVLLDSSFSCKVADFGFARELKEDSEYYRNDPAGQIAVRWMAPEVLESRKHRTQSDVWSFGVTLYEIWTQAATPYEGCSAVDVWMKVCSGFRLPRPSKMPQEIYSIIKRCWAKEAKDRPSFATLYDELNFLMNLEDKEVVKELQLSTSITKRIESVGGSVSPRGTLKDGAAGEAAPPIMPRSTEGRAQSIATNYVQETSLDLALSTSTYVSALNVGKQPQSPQQVLEGSDETGDNYVFMESAAPSSSLAGYTRHLGSPGSDSASHSAISSSQYIAMPSAAVAASPVPAAGSEYVAIGMPSSPTPSTAVSGSEYVAFETGSGRASSSSAAVVPGREYVSFTNGSPPKAPPTAREYVAFADTGASTPRSSAAGKGRISTSSAVGPLFSEEDRRRNGGRREEGHREERRRSTLAHNEGRVSPVKFVPQLSLEDMNNNYISESDVNPVKKASTTSGANGHAPKRKLPVMSSDVDSGVDRSTVPSPSGGGASGGGRPGSPDKVSSGFPSAEVFKPTPPGQKPLVRGKWTPAPVLSIDGVNEYVSLI